MVILWLGKGFIVDKRERDLVRVIWGVCYGYFLGGWEE